ncbi:MAG: TetR/AcrR family transcriptional regulator [Acidimicrobiales bacterium]
MSGPVGGLLRRRMPAQQRRNQLLDAALERFARKGYHDTSMEEIAEAAGVTKPVLYHHFASKTELFVELLDTVGEKLLLDMSARISAETSPYRRVLAGFSSYFEFVSTSTSAYQLLFASGARMSEEFAAPVRKLEEEVAKVIASFVEADIDDSHRELLGFAIVGLGEVAARRWVTTRLAGGEASVDDALSSSSTGPTGGGERIASQRLDPGEGDLMAVRLADLVWAGLRALPADKSAVHETKKDPVIP